MFLSTLDRPPLSLDLLAALGDPFDPRRTSAPFGFSGRPALAFDEHGLPELAEADAVGFNWATFEARIDEKAKEAQMRLLEEGLVPAPPPASSAPAPLAPAPSPRPSAPPTEREGPPRPLLTHPLSPVSDSESEGSEAYSTPRDPDAPPHKAGAFGFCECQGCREWRLENFSAQVPATQQAGAIPASPPVTVDVEGALPPLVHANSNIFEGC
eukprot:tig00020572_g11588.t1